MKIGFVLDDTLDSNDGVQQHVKLLGSWLENKGHQVNYLVGESKSKKANVYSFTKNVKVRFNANSLSVPLKVNSKSIKEHLKSQKYDILHIQMPHSPLFANKVIMQASSKVGLVGTFHIAPYGAMSNMGTKLIKIFINNGLKKIDEFISVSGVAQQFAFKKLNIKSQIIPNAVDTNLFKNDPNKDIDIIFLGRLVKRKGCEHLINAIKLIDQNKKLKVAIVGDGLLKDKLMHKVKSYKLNESITFYGHVNEQHKKLLLSRAKLAIFPSVGGESFGIVLLEAMSSGALVIAGDNPGYKSVMGNNSNAIVNPKKSYLFAKTINSFLTNSTLYKKELSYQQNIIKHFDINQVGNDILNVYKKAINKHKNE